MRFINCSLVITVVAIITSLSGCEPTKIEPKKYRPDLGDQATGDTVGSDATSGDNLNGDAAGDATSGDASSPVWYCKPTYYGTDDGCDCGCGIPDPDCNGQGCIEGSCNNATCEFCHNDTGIMFSCGDTPPPDVPSGWTCEQFFYADQLCDCGCGVTDPDCAGSGCTASDCSTPACEFCWPGGGSGTCSGGDGGPPGGD